MAGKRLILHSDGASLGNPGPAAIGVVIEDEVGRVVAQVSKYIGRTTNNRAEYLALIAGLEEAARLGARELEIRLDSELIVLQLQGKYKSKKLEALYWRTLYLMQKFDHCDVSHVPGFTNQSAHSLAHHALREAKKKAGY